jgi:integrase
VRHERRGARARRDLGHSARRANADAEQGRGEAAHPPGLHAGGQADPAHGRAGRELAGCGAIASGIDEEIAAELAGADGEPISLTVGMLAEKWVSARGDASSLRYRDETCDRIDRIILPAIGSKNVADLTWDDMAARVQGQPSASGQRLVSSVLSGMLDFGVDSGIVDGAVRKILPTLGAFRRRSAEVTVDATNPDSAETTAVLELLDDYDDERRLSSIKLDSAPGYYSLMFLVAAFCGLRQGEIWALRGKDVDGLVLNVDRQLTWVKGKPHFTLPKGGKRRQVFIKETVEGFPLRAMLEARAAEVGVNGRLFPTPKGGLFWRSNFARTSWVRCGPPIQDVADLAGHSNAKVT